MCTVSAIQRGWCNFCPPCFHWLWRLTLETSPFTVVSSRLSSTRLMKPNFHVSLSHWHSTTVSVETRNLFTLLSAYFTSTCSANVHAQVLFVSQQCSYPYVPYGGENSSTLQHICNLKWGYIERTEQLSRRKGMFHRRSRGWHFSPSLPESLACSGPKSRRES